MKSKNYLLKVFSNYRILFLIMIVVTSNSHAFTSNIESPFVKSKNVIVVALRTKICKNVAEIKAAMADARAGDEIIINPGIYLSDGKVKDGIGKYNCFSGLANGTAANPIIIRGASTSLKTILKPAPSLEFNAPVLGITGDYWIIKDLEFSHGQRGIIFDTANYGQIINVDVHTIDQEGIHLRSNSSNNLIDKCRIKNTGVNSPGYGEGIYIGSDQKSHSDYPPNCDKNTVQNCTFGPNIRAEGIDIKEGTQYTTVKGCTFSAAGISNVNSADAFIDAKGGYTFIYNNTFNSDNESNLASGVDFQQRDGINSGYRIAIFNNTFNLGTSKAGIPTARKKGGTPSQIHIWNNIRNPKSSDFPISDGTINFVTESCPTWNVIPCGTSSNINTAPSSVITSPASGSTYKAGSTIVITASASDNGSVTKVVFYRGAAIIGTDTTSPYQCTISNAVAGNYAIKAVATDNQGATASSNVVYLVVSTVVVVTPTDPIIPTVPTSGCTFGTPTTSGLGSFDRSVFTKMYKMGSGGPIASNFKNFKINWNLGTKSLAQFAYSTNNGLPDYYIDLRPLIQQNFASSKPYVTISKSGITGLDGSYWVAKKGLNLVLVSKTGGYTLYFSNDTAAPACSSSKMANPDIKIVNDELRINSLGIFPNPSTGLINITGLEVDSNLFISDMLGKIVYSKFILKHEKSIDVSHLINGIYILTIENNGIPNNIKVVISK